MFVDLIGAKSVSKIRLHNCTHEIVQAAVDYFDSEVYDDSAKEIFKSAVISLILTEKASNFHEFPNLLKVEITADVTEIYHWKWYGRCIPSTSVEHLAISIYCVTKDFFEIFEELQMIFPCVKVLEVNWKYYYDIEEFDYTEDKVVSESSLEDEEESDDEEYIYGERRNGRQLVPGVITPPVSDEERTFVKWNGEKNFSCNIFV